MTHLRRSMLALSLFAPAGANAELLKNLKLSGRIDLQATAARNIVDFQTAGAPAGAGSMPAAYNGQDTIGDVLTRVLVSLDWDLLDDVHSRVSMVKADKRVWGNSSQSVTALEASFFAGEASMKIDKLFGRVDATLGRQFLGEEGDLIAYYGPTTNHYGLRVSSLDAAKFDMGGERWTLSALGGKPNNDADLGIAETGNQGIRAIILGNAGNANISGRLYIWNKTTYNTNGALGTAPSTTTAGALNDNLYIIGLKAKITAGPAWLRAEFAKNFGARREKETPSQAGASTYSGWALLLNGGAKVEAANIGMVTGWAEFGYGTGASDSKSNESDGFKSINTDYRPGALYGRFATTDRIFADRIGAAARGNPASNGLSNRVVRGAGVKLTPAGADKLTVALSAWDFWFQHSGRQVGPAGSQPAIGGNGNRHIGNEYDAELAWRHSENVLVKLGAASFQAGGFIQESIKLANNRRGNNPAYLFTSDVSVKF